MPAALILTVALAFAALFPSAGLADQVMPDLINVPSGWFVDRYTPHSFTNIRAFQGRDNVLGIEITAAEGVNNRPYKGSFYNTQGRGYVIAGGAGSVLSADLYIPTSWSDPTNGNFRSDLWGVLSDKTGAVSSYPTIGFTNYDGAPRYRIWDDVNGYWINLPTLVKFDAWTSFAIQFTGTSYVYSINGTPVLTDTEINGSTAFKEVIMQAYNFYDSSLTDANPVDYSAYWSNTPARTPLPGSLLLLGTGLFALGLLTRRKFFRKEAKHPDE